MICLIPCYNRPEFLKLCLEQIQTNDCKGIKFLFHVDFGYSRDIIKVIKDFRLDKEIVFNQRHRFNKLPVNILEGYRQAAKRAKKYVFMIEEDIMVSNDFFNWHRKIQQDGNWFCSIATKNNNLLKNHYFEPVINNYYTSHVTYQSLGVCFKKEVLTKIVLPYAKEDYYRYNTDYCIKTFPKSILRRNWCEQAGLIRRIQEVSGLRIAYPYVPRAYHAGFYGKNRMGIIGGTLTNKVRMIRSIIFDHSMMRKHSNQKEYYEDSKPIELKLPKYNKIVLKQEFD